MRPEVRFVRGVASGARLVVGSAMVLDAPQKRRRSAHHSDTASLLAERSDMVDGLVASLGSTSSWIAVPGSQISLAIRLHRFWNRSGALESRWRSTDGRTGQTRVALSRSALRTSGSRVLRYQVASAIAQVESLH